MRTLIILVMLITPVLGISQDLGKAGKKAGKILRHQQMKELIDTKEFVLIADRLRDRRGNQVFVNQLTNFIAVADSVGVVQVAFNNGVIGRNGVGGETVDGRLSKFRVTDQGVGKGFVIRTNLFGYANLDIFLDISDSGYTTARINGLRGQQLIFVGNLTPLEGSDIFIGQTTF